MQTILDSAELLYSDMDKKLKLFTRHDYKDAFEDFQRENSVFYGELKKLLREQEDSIDQSIFVIISQAVAQAAQQKMGDGLSKIKMREKQLNINLMTVVYVIPAIVALKEQRAEELAEVLCREWGKVFPGTNIRHSNSQDIQSGFKTKLCYITTAICQSMGKPEQCYELTLLKKYRDEYLAQTEEGRKIIHDYYDIAPTIVKRLNREEDAAAKYLQLWENYLKPCVHMIEAGENEACREKYTNMVEWLHQEYMEGYYGKRAGTEILSV